MAASMKCCCHVLEDEDGEIIPFSTKRWQTFLKFVSVWIDLDRIEKEVAEQYVQYLPDLPNPDSCFGYHENCYKTFTNKQNPITAQKRLPKSALPIKANIPKRTRDLNPSVSRRNDNVLPEQWFICREDKYTTDSYSKKRKKEDLTMCEYKEGLQCIVYKCYKGFVDKSGGIRMVRIPHLKYRVLESYDL